MMLSANDCHFQIFEEKLILSEQHTKNVYSKFEGPTALPMVGFNFYPEHSNNNKKDSEAMAAQAVWLFGFLGGVGGCNKY